MIIQRSAVQKEDSVISEYLIPFCSMLVFILIVIFIIKCFPADGFSKDILVSDFRFDVNKLTEASSAIEAKRRVSPDSGLNRYGATGELLSPDEINQDLRRLLLKKASIEGGSLHYAVDTLGIMCLNEELYSEELKSFELYNLSCDNNLKHYVVITKGEFAGTILYNGDMRFIDSKNRFFFGVELFEQL